jgi:hypothetical protein
VLSLNYYALITKFKGLFSTDKPYTITGWVSCWKYNIIICAFKDGTKKTLEGSSSSNGEENYLRMLQKKAVKKFSSVKKRKDKCLDCFWFITGRLVPWIQLLLTGCWWCTAGLVCLALPSAKGSCLPQLVTTFHVGGGGDILQIVMPERHRGTTGQVWLMLQSPLGIRLRSDSRWCASSDFNLVPSLFFFRELSVHLLILYFCFRLCF